MHTVRHATHAEHNQLRANAAVQVGICLVGLSSVLSGEGSATQKIATGEMLLGMGLIIGSQASIFASCACEQHYGHDPDSKVIAPYLPSQRSLRLFSNTATPTWLLVSSGHVASNGLPYPSDPRDTIKLRLQPACQVFLTGSSLVATTGVNNPWELLTSDATSQQPYA